MRPHPGMLLTGAQAATLVGVSRQLIRRWVLLGRLSRIDTPDGPRYRAADVWQAEADTSASPYSRRARDRTRTAA